MKKTLFLLLLAMFGFLGANAQNLTVPEPEFSDQAYLVTSESTYKKLVRETGYLKTKAGASLYLVGIGKVKTRVTLEGNESSVSTPAGEVRIILKARDNNTDPQSFINAFQFEVKGKERRAQIAEAGTFSASKENTLGQLEFNAQKYGTSSYLIVFDNLKPGEYGIVIGDPNNDNKKNDLKVTTFSVK